MMRLLFLIVMMMPVMAFAGSQTEFSNVIQDLPLMKGLVEIEEQAVVFDKPEGRIVESVAMIESLARADIILYYAQSLPQLGWRQIADRSYSRGNEILLFEFENHQGQNFIRFTVKPN